MNKQTKHYKETSGNALSALPSFIRKELLTLGLLAGLGAIASYLSVNIPGTELYIEGRWVFGFMGFALLRWWGSALLLAGLLSITGSHQVPLGVYLPGNMLYAVPCLVAIRLVYTRILARQHNLLLYGLGWLLLVLACYQVFTTPAIWAVASMLQDTPLWPTILSGWQEQIYLVESVLVGIISALGMTVLRSYRELRRSRQELAITLDSIGDGVMTTDAHGCVTRMNAVAEALTGWPLEEARGRPITEVFHIINAHTRQPVANPVDRVLQEKLVVELVNDTRLVARDGTERQITDSAAPIHRANGQLLGMVMVFHDVTHEYEARAARQQAAESYSLFCRMATQLICIADINTATFLQVNPAFERFLGYSEAELLSRPFIDFIHPDDVERTKAIIEQKLQQGFNVISFENRYRHKDGSYRYLDWNSHPIPEQGRTYAIAHDITEQKQAEKEKARLEAQVRQTQRLESIGRLAGGVAHDLNNLLTPILGYSEMLLEGFSEGDARKADLEKIHHASLRARDLVRQLLAFGRKQLLEFKPVDLNQVLTLFEKLLRRTIREDVDIKVVLAPSVPLIKGDVGQLEQVIMNLAVNAQDSMPDGGTLSIQTAEVEMDEAYAATHKDAVPGRYVMLSVSDTGCGMDAEVREHLFEPFFTTKAQDQGTGLGLATVYGIIKQHSGNIWVYSEPGQGTTFKVYLPVAGELEAIEEDKAVIEPKHWDGSETILLVEDDRQVRELSHTILKRQGYAILVAETGQAALEIANHRNRPIDLLLTDVVMPGMSGKELFTRISGQCPDIKVLYMSGYTDDVTAQRGVLEEGTNFIQKPFSVQALAAKVRKVLDNN